MCSAIARGTPRTGLLRAMAIDGANGGMGPRDHLDEAVSQSGGQPMVIQLVIYNLPRP